MSDRYLSPNTRKSEKWSASVCEHERKPSQCVSTSSRVGSGGGEVFSLPPSPEARPVAEVGVSRGGVSSCGGEFSPATAESARRQRPPAREGTCEVSDTGGRCRREALGLSSSAYLRAGRWEVEWWEGADLVTLRPKLDCGPVAEKGFTSYGGGPRGAIRGLSSAARRRMRKVLNTIRREEWCRGIEITLTFPDCPEEAWAKQRFRAFRDRLRRLFPEHAGFWKMEYQKRGSVHFHLLVLGIEFVAHEWVARSWFEVVGSGSRAHLEAGTQTRRIRSVAQARSYVAKYVSKGVDGDRPGCGRFWGTWGPLSVYQGKAQRSIEHSATIASLARVVDGHRRAVSRLGRVDLRRRVRRSRRRKEWKTRGTYWLCPGEVVGRLLGPAPWSRS